MIRRPNGVVLTCSGYPRFNRGLCNHTPNFWVFTDLEEEEEAEEEEEEEEKKRRSFRMQGIRRRVEGLRTVHPLSLKLF